MSVFLALFLSRFSSCFESFLVRFCVCFVLFALVFMFYEKCGNYASCVFSFRFLEHKWSIQEHVKVRSEARKGVWRNKGDSRKEQ